MTAPTTDRSCTLCGSENNQSLTVLRDGTQLCQGCSDKLYEWRRAVDDEATAALGGPSPMRCPRRDEMFQQGGDPAQTPDEWRILDGQLRCSYCGSLHPDAFMERARAGDQVGPTDKNYKVYLDEPWAKFYFQHLSVDQRHEFIAMLNVKNGHAELAPEGTPAMNIGYPGHFYTEPFFITKAAS